MEQVRSGMSLGERFNALRSNYTEFAEMVAAGHASWTDASEDPYQIGDWAMLLTPIEAAAWASIRCSRIPLWPQLPVGKYFVDFGCPVKRVALECDGKQWHDPKKDQARDNALEQMGWTTYRVPGWQCLADDGREMSRFLKSIARHWA